MAGMNQRSTGVIRRRLTGVGAAVVSMLMMIGLVGAGTAGAWSADVSGRIDTDEVWSPAMNRHIKVQWQHAAGGSGGAPTLYLLDGLRAQEDFSGWDIMTNAFDKFAHDRINVVTPVGGQSSFYADWISPSNFNGQDFTYKWETFMMHELPAHMEHEHGVRPDRNAIMGVSMSGSSALYFAAKQKFRYSFAGSLSGYLNLSTPGMPMSIRVAMLDAGLFNVDAMWGPPWSQGWVDHDPFVFAPELRGLSLYVAAGSATPDPSNGDNPVSLQDHWNNGMGIGLEALSLATTKVFELRLDSLGIPATFSFPIGVHNWNNWNRELDKAKGQIMDATR